MKAIQGSVEDLQGTLGLLKWSTELLQGPLRTKRYLEHVKDPIKPLQWWSIELVVPLYSPLEVLQWSPELPQRPWKSLTTRPNQRSVDLSKDLSKDLLNRLKDPWSPLKDHRNPFKLRGIPLKATKSSSSIIWSILRIHGVLSRPHWPVKPLGVPTPAKVQGCTTILKSSISSRTL